MENYFSLEYAVTTILKKWKTILLFVIISAVAATITVYMVPPFYKSEASVVSANPALADKGRMFNNNIQILYSYFGSGDDLDRIQGIADMDTVFFKLVDEFSLTDYYHLNTDDPGGMRLKAMYALRKDIHFLKTEQNQLKITAWTKDKQLSANLINRLVGIVQETGANVWKKNYSASIAQLHKSITEMESEYKQLVDSSRQELTAIRTQALLEEIKQFHKTENEYQLALQTPPDFLHVMQTAAPAAFAERPDKPVIIVTACLAALVFSFLFILVNNRNTTG